MMKDGEWSLWTMVSTVGWRWISYSVAAASCKWGDDNTMMIVCNKEWKGWKLRACLISTYSWSPLPLPHLALDAFLLIMQIQPPQVVHRAIKTETMAKRKPAHWNPMLWTCLWWITAPSHQFLIAWGVWLWWQMWHRMSRSQWCMN